MIRTASWIVAVTFGLSCCCTEAVAQFYDITVYKSALYDQVGSQVPTVRGVDAGLLLPPGELIGPQGPVVLTPFVGTTRADVDQHVPEGSYRFLPTDGVAAGVEIGFEIGPDWWPSVPTFTAASMDKVSSLVDPAEEITLQWAPFQPAASAPKPRISIYLDSEDESLIFDRNVPTSLDRLTLPAGTLKPGKSYDMSLWFTNSREGLERDGQLSVFRTLDVSAATRVRFQTVPEPVTNSVAIGCLLLSLCRGMGRRRTRS